jgi:hypothetical protein
MLVGATNSIVELLITMLVELEELDYHHSNLRKILQCQLYAQNLQYKAFASSSFCTYANPITQSEGKEINSPTSKEKGHRRYPAMASRKKSIQLNDSAVRSCTSEQAGSGD